MIYVSRILLQVPSNLKLFYFPYTDDFDIIKLQRHDNACVYRLPDSMKESTNSSLEYLSKPVPDNNPYNNLLFHTSRFQNLFRSSREKLPYYFNPLPYMPILGSSNSAAKKDIISKI